MENETGNHPTGNSESKVQEAFDQLENSLAILDYLGASIEFLLSENGGHIGFGVASVISHVSNLVTDAENTFRVFQRGSHESRI